MNREEKLMLCRRCTNRSHDYRRGTICSITGAIGFWEDECRSFNEDPSVSVESLKQQSASTGQAKTRRQRELWGEENLSDTEAPKISGFLSFYLYFFTPVGILISMVMFALRLKLDASGVELWWQLVDMLYMLFYCYFGIYTIYGFVKRKPDAVFIAKYHLIFLIIDKFIGLIAGPGDSVLTSAPNMMSGAVMSALLLSYLYTSKLVARLIPKESRRVGGFNLTMVVLSAVFLSFFIILSIISRYLNAA